MSITPDGRNVLDVILLNPTTGQPYVASGGGGGGTAYTETLWTDDTGTFYVRIDTGPSTAPLWNTPMGVLIPTFIPGANLRPADGAAIILDTSRYQATALRVSDIALGDYLSHVVTADPATGAVIANFWLNATQSAKLATAPSSSIIAPVSSLPAGAAQDGVDWSLAPALGGVSGSGIRGWLSGIFTKLSNPLSVYGGTAIGVALANPPLAVAGLDSGGLKRAILTDTNGAMVLAASANIIGKAGIDQTTPGTTNGVVVNSTPLAEGAASFATTQVSIGLSSALIVAARTGALGVGRVSVTVYNSGATTVYYGASIGVTVSGVGAGAILPAGASVTLNTTAAIYGITSSGTNILGVTETF